MTPEKIRKRQRRLRKRAAAIEKEGRLVRSYDEWKQDRYEMIDEYMQARIKQQAKEPAAAYTEEIEKRINDIFKKLQ